MLGATLRDSWLSLRPGGGARRKTHGFASTADPPAEPADSRDATAPRRISRRATIIGSLIAMLVVAGIGWLAWDLTHPDTTAVAEGGRPVPARRAVAVPAAAAAGGRGAGHDGRYRHRRSRRHPDRPRRPGHRGPAGHRPGAAAGFGRAAAGALQGRPDGRKGELLATIDPRQFEMALQQTSGQRMRDEAQLEAARVTLARFRTCCSRTRSRARKSTPRPRWSSSSKHRS